MKIERIYILSYAKDTRWARCSVASIRNWYPDIPISLIKDETKGAYSTEDFERYWGVGVYRTPRKHLGYGFGKLEPLFEKQRERCLIIDSDTVFLGPVLETLEQYDDDFIIEQSDYPDDEMVAYYIDFDKLRGIEPSFRFPGYTFNTGQFVATTGLLTREDFAPYVEFYEPPHLSHGEVFKAGDQGILNFTLMRKAQAGEISLRRTPMMRWPVHVHRGSVPLPKLMDRSQHRCVVHWAGPKPAFFTLAAAGYLLKHFEAAYYAGIPHGRFARFQARWANLLEVVQRKRPWKGYA